MWMATDLTATTSFVHIMIRTIVLRIGLSFITMPLHTAALNALPLELGSHGSAVNNTVRQLAGAVGTAVIVMVYTIQSTAYTDAKALAPIMGANDTYLFMLVVAVVAFVLILFVPAEKKKQQQEV